MELLNRQLAAVRTQLEELNNALDAAKAAAADKDLKIEELGKELNIALAQRTRELARYRSEFFGRLRAVLDRAPRLREGPDLTPQRPNRAGAPRGAFENFGGRGAKINVSPARGARNAPRLRESININIATTHFDALAYARCSLSFKTAFSPRRGALFLTPVNSCP
mgnify:CR=1 FL=1